ncbi:MAG: hypothetical protein IJX92_03605 [Clostridia bacterium]|nr:hypothetical protein [Clostridia bacterium]
MFDNKNSSYIDLDASEEDKSYPVKLRDEDELDALMVALNDNVVTTDKQSEHEFATSSNLLYLNSSGGKVRVSENVEVAIRHIAKEYKRIDTDTFYRYLEQYNGIVETINFESETFTAVLTSVVDETQKVLAEFDFEDLQYPSDKALINIGASFVWLIGKETQKTGQQTNISKIVLRRTRALSSQKIEEAERKANEWTEFFRSIVVSDSTDG